MTSTQWLGADQPDSSDYDDHDGGGNRAAHGMESKLMHKFQRIAVLVLTFVATVGCDQVTKAVAQSRLSAAPPIVLLNGMFRFEYAENPGAFLSLGASWPPAMQQAVFIVAATLLLGGVLVFTLRAAPELPLRVLAALALILSGGVGNLIDRVMREGRVIDFMHFGIGVVRTGVFNVADMALMAGIVLMAFSGFGLSAKPTPDPAAE